MEPTSSSTLTSFLSTTPVELTPYSRSSKCQICNKTAHGFHHGALTCRACCAFFRRSVGVHQNWKCKGEKNCETNNKGYFCKKCRIEKCFKNGMTSEKFQFERDCISNSGVDRRVIQLPTSLEKFIGRPHIIIRCEPKSSKIKKTFLDFTKLIDKGFNILSKDHENTLGTVESSCVQKLANYMTEMRKSKPHGDMVYRKIGKKESLMFWELDFCRAAEWLSHFDEFQELPITLKMTFLKTIWSLWAVLEKIALTAEKTSGKFPDMIPLDEIASIDTENLEIDISWCTHYDLDKLSYFLDVHQECMQLMGIANVLMDLLPTDVEQNFLFLQICFSYAGRRHQGEILTISEKLLETVTNQMHDYYCNVLKTPHYSGRIVKIMKCDKLIQEFIASRRQKIEIAQIFDIFNLQYSHPELFIDSGF